MAELQPLTPPQAEQQVQAGSDIVVIPYSAYMEPDGVVRMGTFTHMAVQAAVALYSRAATENTAVIAVGEHTYGTGQTSTTELMYDYMEAHGVPAASFATEHPTMANSTPQQVDWLRHIFGPRWRGRAPVLVGHEPHWDRIKYLCDLYGLPAEFVDSATMLDSVGQLTAQQAKAVELYAAENARYEATATRITRIVAGLGPAAVTTVFTTLAYLRSPTVLDASTGKHGVRLYATHSRRHRRELQRSEA
jgi:hypothetical protein